MQLSVNPEKLEVDFDVLRPPAQFSSLDRVLCSRAPKVLSIDDNKICQKIHETLLKKCGCVIELAGTAKEALEKLVVPYEIIFLEPRLPDFCGEALIDLIRYDKQSVNKKTPIIIISSGAKANLNKKYFSREIEAIFIKPILIHEVRVILKKYDVI